MNIGDLVKLNLRHHDRGIGIIIEVRSIKTEYRFRVFWLERNFENVYSKSNLLLWKEATILSKLLFTV